MERNLAQTCVTNPAQLLLGLALFLWPAGLVSATEIPLVNADFEADFVNLNASVGPLVTGTIGTPISGNFHNVSLPSGWELICPNPAANYNSYNTVGVLSPGTTQLFNPGQADGQVALIYLESGTQSAGTSPLIGLRQVTGHRLQSFKRYHMRVDIGNIRTDPALNDDTIYPTDLAGFPGYRIELWAGSQQLAFDEWDGTPGNPKQIAEGDFRTVGISHTTSFVPTSLLLLAPRLEVRLYNLNRPIAGAGDNMYTNAGEVNFDNVEVWTEPVIPLPRLPRLLELIP
jgi:hypothetical protein